MRKRVLRLVRTVPPVPTEATEQVLLAKWLNLRRVLWMHTPNGGHRAMSEARRFKQMGLAPGVPDILIFDPPPFMKRDGTVALPPQVGVAIELKRIKGGRLSDEQAAWLHALAERGWLTRVCKGAQEAIDWLTELGY